MSQEVLEKEFAASVDLHEVSPNQNEDTGETLLERGVEKIPCLIDPIIPKVGIGCLAGGSDTGKSCLLRQLALNITLKYARFIGFEIKAIHNSALIVSTEDERNAISFLLQKQAGGTKPELLRKLRFIFDFENLLAEIDRKLTEEISDLVIVDCFADVFTGDLKDTQKIRVFLNEYQRMAEKHGCFILFLHHTGKRTENFEPSKNNLLSGQGFEAKMRLVIELRQDLLNPSKRHFCIVKGNYLPAQMKRESFVLKFSEENFLFTTDGDRVPFELLVKKEPGQQEREKFEMALQLKKQGKTSQQIADLIGYASKGSVSKLFDRARKNGWVSEGVSLGNDKGNGEHGE